MPNKNAIQVVCLAEFRAKEGKTDALIEALHGLMKPTHSEPGCIRYELNQRVDDPRCITFVEKFKDQKAFDDHCATPYVSGFFKDVHPGLVETFEAKLFREILP
jgi:quinol monooxygenase YgiN